MLVRREGNEQRYYSLFLLPKQNNPTYYENLIRNAKNFYYGLGHEELVEKLENMIYYMIEKPMGSKIQNILIVHRNLPTMNSFTRSRNPLYSELNVHKYTIQGWLDQIERWIFQRAIDCESEIRFQNPKQFI